MTIKPLQKIDYGFKYSVTGSGGTTFNVTEGDLVLNSVPGFARSGTPVANERFLGVAMETVQNSGTAGAKTVLASNGIILMDCTGTFADADIGKYVYVHNSTRVALSGVLTPGTVAVGVVLDIDTAGSNTAAKAWINTGVAALVSLG